MSLRRHNLLLAAWMLLALTLIVPASAQLKQLSLPDTTAMKGDTLLIPIRISSLAMSDSVYAGQITLSYNPGLMTIYGIQTAGTLTQGGVSTSFNATTRQFAFASGGILTGSGTLVYLKVGTLLSPSALTDSIRITSGVLNEGNPGTSIRNGYFRFLSMSVSPQTPSGTFAVGDSMQFGVSGDYLAPLTWTTSNSSIGTISATGRLRGVGVGQIKVFVTDSRGLKDSTNLFAVNSAQLTSLTLSVHDTSYTQTLYFNLPIYISDVSALGIYSGQFSLTFNSSILQATDVVTTGSMTSAWSAPAFNITGGRIDVALAGSQPASGAGVLAYVRFRVLPTAFGTTALTLSSVQFNENFNATLINRTFSTLAAPTVVITPSTATVTRGDTLRFRVTSGGTPPYTWSSSAPGVAGINSTGLLTGVTRGTTTVTVVDNLGFSATTGTININDLRVSMPDTTVAASDSVDVPVRVDDLTGLGIYSYDLRLVYDSTIVRFAQILNTGTMSSAMNIAVRDTLDTLRVGGAGATALAGSGTLFKIRFKAAPGVTLGQLSNLGFVFFRFNEAGSSTPTATTANGRITIGTPATLPPSPPTLASPLDLSSSMPINPTLSWNASTGATSYMLQVSTASNFSSLVVNQSGLTSTSYAASGFTNNTLYYWRVSATNANGTSAYATVWSFTTAVAPPGAPTLVSPADSATNLATNPTLSWNASATATSYTVQISTSSSFSTFVVNQSGIAGTSYNAGGLSSGTQYFWRVSASNAGGASAFSAPRLFTTVSGPPAAPTLVSPADSATNVSVSPTLSWNAPANAASYTIQVSTNSGFSSFVVNQSGVAGTSHSASGLSNGTQHFWRVSATNAGGTGGYSATRLFTTTALSPPVPTLTSPANADTGISVSPVLSWGASTGATSYTLQVSAVANFSSLILSQSGISGTSFAIGPLGTSTVYYWRVSATNASGTSAYSSAFSFSTVMQPPPVPTLVSPANAAIDLGLSQTLKWKAVPGTTSYALQIAFDSLFTSLLNYEPSLADTSYVPTAGLINSTTYFWRVRASNAGGTSAYSALFKFSTIIAAPPTGSLVSPANFSTGIALSRTLSWNALARATSYNVQVSTDIAFGSFVVNQTGIASTSYVAAGLSPNTTYYWKVSGSNAGGTGLWSSAFNFTTGSGVPPAPTLSSPANAAIGVALSPTVSWNASTGATSYTLQVSTASNFSSLVVNQSGLTSTTYAASGLTNNTLYYWRVSATNANGASAYATVWSFTTAVAAPGAPTLVSPADSAVNLATNPTLSWNASATATSYTVQISANSSFSSFIVNQNGIAGTSYNAGGLSTSTQYFWRVTATNAGGTSAFSAVRLFTTVSGPPSAPTLVSPNNGAVNAGSAGSFVLIWNASTGATSYTLQVSTAADFSTLVVNQSYTNTASSFILPLGPNTLYYWRVSATNAGGTSAFSSVFSFTTSIAPPAAPTLVSPNDGAVNVGPAGSFGLIWNASTGATSYTLQVSTAADFSTLLVNQSYTNTASSFILPLGPNTLYYWRVSATNAGGTSAFSSVLSFTTIVIVPPAAPTLLAPLNGASGVGLISVKVDLSWSSSPGAASYTIQVSTSADFSTLVVNQSGITSTSYQTTPNSLATNTLYYWRVSATNAGGTSANSTAFSFTTAVLPAGPTLYWPPNDTTGVPITQWLTWMNSPGVTSYTVQVSTSATFSPDSTQTTSVPAPPSSGSFPLYVVDNNIGPLKNNTLYYWRASATTAGGTTAYSGPWRFRTAANVVTLFWPPNDTTGVPITQWLTWMNSPGVTSYTVQVSTSATFSPDSTQTTSVPAPPSSGSFPLYVVDNNIGPLKNNTLYYWRVSATTAGGTTAYSGPWRFRTAANVLAAPVLLSPANGVISDVLNPTLSWNASTGATSYTVQVSTAADFSSFVVNQSGITTTSLTTGPLTPKKTYYWRVSATNAGGTSQFSSVFSFIPPLPLPGATMLFDPPDGATNIPTRPMFVWASVPGASTYQIEICRNLGFSPPEISSGAPASGDPTNQIFLGAGPLFGRQLSSGTQYYWRVRGLNTQNMPGPWSAASFTTVAKAPLAPILISPANVATGISINPRFTWNDTLQVTSPQAVSYTLQVSVASDFSSLIVNDTNAISGFSSASGLAPLTKYFWRVNAKNELGTSPFSTPFSFTTNATAPPSPPTLLNPPNGSTGVIPPPSFAWLTSGGANYTLQVSTVSDFSVLVVNQSGLTGNGTSIGPLNHNTLYYWRMSATTVGGTSAFSSVWSFTTAIAPPSPPTLLNPPNGSTGVIPSPSFAWLTSGGANYTLQVSTVSDFSVLVVNQSGITGNGTSIGPLNYNTLYYWRMSATTVGGTSAFSSVFSFTTAIAPPSPPTLLNPPNGSTGVIPSPSFAWLTSGGANYTLQVSTVSDFSVLVVNQSGLTGNGTSIGPLNHNTLYYWRMSATTVGGTSAFSSVWSFTTAPSTTAIERMSDQIPDAYALNQNYPNPFNPSTMVPFSLPHRSVVRVSVYSLLGNEVAVLVNGERSAGSYEVRFDAGVYPSGVYLIKMQASPVEGTLDRPFIATRKIVLIK